MRVAVVSAIVLILFIRTEDRRLGMRLLWLPIISVLLVGVSLGLPLFLILDNSDSIDRADLNHFHHFRPIGSGLFARSFF